MHKLPTVRVNMSNVRPMLTEFERPIVCEVATIVVEQAPLSYDRKTTLSTLANLFVFFSLLGFSLWLYTVYKNKTINYVSVVGDEGQPLLDYKTFENLEPYNNLQHDGSLDFTNLS